MNLLCEDQNIVALNNIPYIILHKFNGNKIITFFEKTQIIQKIFLFEILYDYKISVLVIKEDSLNKNFEKYHLIINSDHKRFIEIHPNNTKIILNKIY